MKCIEKIINFRNNISLLLHNMIIDFTHLQLFLLNNYLLNNI